MEQEQRDHELALRLATETNGEVESPTSGSATLRRSESVVAERQTNLLKKHDLSKWKYADLRDTINTSCDVELLEACREEFHRRLKVYHQWKTTNKRHHVASEAENKAEQKARRGGGDGYERAPRDIVRNALRHQNDAAEMDAVNGGPTTTPPRANEARYFRVPFTRQDALTTTKSAAGSTGAVISGVKRGWWYAHFNGRWIQRQMEVYPNAKPILLLAGKDDMQMCELSLEETGLTNRKGAEILVTDFEREWDKHAQNIGK